MQSVLNIGVRTLKSAKNSRNSEVQLASRRIDRGARGIDAYRGRVSVARNRERRTGFAARRPRASADYSGSRVRMPRDPIHRGSYERSTGLRYLWHPVGALQQREEIFDRQIGARPWQRKASGEGA